MKYHHLHNLELFHLLDMNYNLKLTYLVHYGRCGRIGEIEAENVHELVPKHPGQAQESEAAHVGPLWVMAALNGDGPYLQDGVSQGVTKERQSQGIGAAL